MITRVSFDNMEKQGVLWLFEVLHYFIKFK